MVVSRGEGWPGCPAAQPYVRVWAMFAERGEKHRQTTALGRALGLSSAETAETIGAWLAWFSSSGHPLSWARVRDALADRAGGDRWRPGEVSAGSLIRAGLPAFDARWSGRPEVAGDTPGGS